MSRRTFDFGHGRAAPWLYGGTGHGALAERTAAVGTDILVQFSGWENKQQPFADGLRHVALWTIKFAGGQCSELWLHNDQVFAMVRRISRRTLMGVCVASIVRMSLGP